MNIYIVNPFKKFKLVKLIPYLEDTLKKVDQTNVNYAFEKGKNCSLGAMNHIGYKYTISFDLVSPEQLVYNDKVGMIIIPGKDGDIGVLPGHSKLLSSLRPGRVMVYGEDKNLLKSFFVSGGFVEVNPEKCIVLAEGVDEMNSLDKNNIEKEMQDLEGQDNEDSKQHLSIVRAKIAALNSAHYEKI